MSERRKNPVVSFGTGLYEFRTALGLSQKSFCQGICSEREYRRFESGEAEPSLYTLDLLSDSYNFDFYSLYKIYSSQNAKRDSDLYNKVNKAVITSDYVALATLTEHIEATMNDYEYGNDLLQVYYFGKALLNKNNDSCIDYSLIGLRIEYPFLKDDVSVILGGAIHNNVSFSLLNCIALYNKYHGDCALAQNILSYMIDEMEKRIKNSTRYYQTHTFSLNLYPKLVINYCGILMKNEDYIGAYDKVNSAISLIISSGSIRYIEKILKCKYRCLQHLNKPEELKETYDSVLCICKLKGETKFAEDFIYSASH